MRFCLSTFFLLICLQVVAQKVPFEKLESTYLYTSLEEALENPEDVIRLSLKGKKLKKSPSVFLKFINIQELNLKRTKLDRFPIELTQLRNLQKLDVSYNKIDQLPAEIGDMKELKVFSCGQNDIEYLPITVGGMQSLVVLDLWGNNIATIPNEISELKNLKRLDLRVIQFSDAKQQDIRDMLPQTKIEFSNSCNCD